MNRQLRPAAWHVLMVAGARFQRLSRLRDCAGLCAGCSFCVCGDPATLSTGKGTMMNEITGCALRTLGEVPGILCQLLDGIACSFLHTGPCDNDIALELFHRRENDGCDQ